VRLMTRCNVLSGHYGFSRRGASSDEVTGLSVANCPVFVRRHYVEDEAIYNVYNL
jgi:hypothetical protein